VLCGSFACVSSFSYSSEFRLDELDEDLSLSAAPPATNMGDDGFL